MKMECISTIMKAHKIMKNRQTEEQLLHREGSKCGWRKQWKCRRLWNISIYLYITLSLSIFFTIKGLAVPMTPGHSKCWKSLAEGALKQCWVPLRKSRGDLLDTVINNRDPCAQGILLYRHTRKNIDTYAHCSPSRRNRISLSVVAIGREHDRGYYTSTHTASLFKSMNMDWDDHNVWTWITHVCQNHTTTGSACVPPTPPTPPVKEKKKRT